MIDDQLFAFHRSLNGLLESEKIVTSTLNDSPARQISHNLAAQLALASTCTYRCQPCRLYTHIDAHMHIMYIIMHSMYIRSIFIYLLYLYCLQVKEHLASYVICIHTLTYYLNIC